MITIVEPGSAIIVEVPATLLFNALPQDANKDLIYRSNTKRSPASSCKIVEQTVFYFVNFFGARSESHAESYKTVSVEHCRLMVQHGRSKFGSLTKSGSVAKTFNPLEFEWPSAPFGFCIEHKLTVVNCFLVPFADVTVPQRPSPQSVTCDIAPTKKDRAFFARIRDGVVPESRGVIPIFVPLQNEGSDVRKCLVERIQGARSFLEADQPFCG
ncbi:unnamed protein product [Heligmosomoides polygyrus]|uniref:FHA domain-containing protein n=1 Tax=Heligmosomoides polygyrus TaxID=6339 RepID=A0A183GAT6_HELPZ|nr:unnamed protein product [Heligmosomoides polygyrus]